MSDYVKTTQWIHGYTIYAKWWGGEYADLSFERDGQAFDVINMWPASGDRPPFEMESLVSAVREWAKSMSSDVLADYRLFIRE